MCKVLDSETVIHPRALVETGITLKITDWVGYFKGKFPPLTIKCISFHLFLEGLLM